MSRARTFQPRQQSTFINQQPLDTTRPIALYGRHSTIEQKGNVATTQQTIGLERLAVQIGFKRTLHRTFYEDLKGVSAYKLALDQRKSMSDLYDSIVRDEIGTVLCFLVDRLFRTKNGVEYETFINACASHNVKVITASIPMKIYNLNNNTDVDEFRARCQDARRYIDEIIKGRLNAARDELGLSGLWCGGSVPTGFLVDLNEASPTYRKYTVYEPHAVIIRAIFKRFRELDGAFNKLASELLSKQPVFPLCGHTVPLSINQEGTGYSLGRDGLRSILTNPAYMGMWLYLGVRMEDNHVAIIDTETFMYAFDALSNYTLEGEEKERTNRRPSQYATTDVQALLRGKLRSEGNNVVVLSPSMHYAIETNINGFHDYASVYPIQPLDKIFADKLIRMLKQSKNKQSTVYDTFQSIRDEQETVFASIEDFIPQIEKNIRILKRNLSLDVDDETAREWASQLKRETAELTRLQNKLVDRQTASTTIEEASTLFEQVSNEFHQMSFTKQCKAVALTVDYVNIVEVSPHFLRLDIQWAMPITYKETAYIFRHVGSRTLWTDEEEATLARMYTNSSVEDMLQALPNRSWLAIRRHGKRMGLPRQFYVHIDKSINQSISVEDREVMKRLKIETVPEDEEMKAYWLPMDRVDFEGMFTNVSIKYNLSQVVEELKVLMDTD